MDDRPAILGGTPALEQEAGIVRPSFADFTSPELLGRIGDVLASNQVTNGVNVRQLEEAMAAYLNVVPIAVAAANRRLLAVWCSASSALGMPLELRGKPAMAVHLKVVPTAVVEAHCRPPAVWCSADSSHFETAFRWRRPVVAAPCPPTYPDG